jgi:hypothetical protein
MRVREEQCCVGLEHRVPLSKEPAQRFGERSAQQYLNAYLMRQVDDTEPRVSIGYNEARRFAHEILALVDELGRRRSPVAQVMQSMGGARSPGDH